MAVIAGLRRVGISRLVQLCEGCLGIVECFLCIRIYKGFLIVGKCIVGIVSRLDCILVILGDILRQLAVDLLTSDAEVSFEHWRKQGATSFREYWQDENNRSHSHPMFGSPVAYFFEYLLGIKQKEYAGGYSDLVIEPVFVSKLNTVSGHMDVPSGRVGVSYTKNDGKVNMSVNIPNGVKAVFVYSDMARKLEAGKNEFVFKL